MNIVVWGTREIPKIENLDELKKNERNKKKKSIVVRELKKIGVTFCCCLKQRCMNFMESKTTPAPPQREQIVKEIIEELGRIESGASLAGNAATIATNPGTATTSSGYTSTPSSRESAVGSNVEPHQQLGSIPDQQGADRQTSNFERQPSYGRPVGSLLEERQRSIVRQLDSIHKDLNKIYDGSGSQAAERTSDYNSASTSSNQQDYRPKANSVEKYKDSESLVYGQNNKEDPYYSCIQSEPKIQRDDLVNPFWITEKDLGRGPVRYLDQMETDFWQKLIEKYLHPIEFDRVHDAKIKSDLATLRSNASFLFFMVNFLWLFIIFLLQVVQDQLKDTLYIRVPTKGGLEYKHFEPLSVAFLVFFAAIILIQFISMLFHRYGTFLHILASTTLKCCSKNYHPIGVEAIVETVKVGVDYTINY